MPLNKDNILVGVGELFSAGQDDPVIGINAASGETVSLADFVTHESPDGGTTWVEYWAEANVFMDGRALDATGAVVTAPAGWRNLGYTQDGVEIAYEPTYGEVNVDQQADAALIFNDGLTVTINTTLVEATLENLVLAWGVDSSALDGKEFSFGTPGSDPVERQILVAGNAPDDTTGDRLEQERVYYARRIVSMEGATAGLQRSAATTYGVSFRSLPNPGDTNQYRGQEYGWIVDRVVNEPTAP